MKRLMINLVSEFYFDDYDFLDYEEVEKLFQSSEDYDDDSQYVFTSDEYGIYVYQIL